MKNIIIFSSGRADYYSLSVLVDFLQKKKIKIHFIQYAYDDYQSLNFKNVSCYLIKKQNNETSIFNKINRALIEIQRFENTYDALCFGDRSEAFFFSHLSRNFKFTLHHYNGGEKTVGSRDNIFRYQISLNANYHYVTNKIYKKNLINFGIDTKKIFVVGNLALDYISKQKLFNKKELIKMKLLDPSKVNVIFCQHPNTINREKTISEIQCSVSFIKKILSIYNVHILITHPNNDPGSSSILDEINNLEINFKKNISLYKNLGFKRYMSVLKYFDLSIGNSSSNFLEAPFFGINVLNLGDRQQGRLKFSNILDCNFDEDNIFKNFLKLSNNNFLKKKIDTKKLGTGNSSNLFYSSYLMIK